MYLLFLETNIRANMFRGTISGVEVKQGIEQVWQTIPTDAFVFPVLLFRKPPHAVFAGWADLPQNIIQRYPPPDQVLEQKQVEFVFYNDYQKNYFPPETREYIEPNYEPTHLPDLLRRKKV